MSKFIHVAPVGLSSLVWPGVTERPRRAIGKPLSLNLYGVTAYQRTVPCLTRFWFEVNDEDVVFMFSATRLARKFPSSR